MKSTYSPKLDAYAAWLDKPLGDLVETLKRVPMSGADIEQIVTEWVEDYALEGGTDLEDFRSFALKAAFQRHEESQGEM